jgi:tryptophanyl-tRNA synthetase
MSKSLDNYISLLAGPDELWDQLRTAATDPARVRLSDPGTPEICNIFTMHKAFSPQEDIDWAAEGCRTAGIGCVDCKKRVAENMLQELEPIQQRYQDLVDNPDRLQAVMQDGAARSREIARATIQEVREKTGLR